MKRRAGKVCTTFATGSKRVDLRVAGREEDGHRGENRKRKVNSDQYSLPDR